MHKLWYGTDFHGSYNSITRFNTDSRGTRPYMPINTSPAGLHRRAESVSSSSSGSASPSALLTPDFSLPFYTPPMDHLSHALQANAWNYLDDTADGKSFGLLNDPFVDEPYAAQPSLSVTDFSPFASAPSFSTNPRPFYPSGYDHCIPPQQPMTHSHPVSQRSFPPTVHGGAHFSSPAPSPTPYSNMRYDSTQWPASSTGPHYPQWTRPPAPDNIVSFSLSPLISSNSCVSLS